MVSWRSVSTMASRDGGGRTGGEAGTDDAREPFAVDERESDRDHEMGDQRALATAREAYALAPQSAAIMDTLGWILVRSGQVPEGLALLEKAAAGANVSPEIKYHYAAALAQSGAKERAKEQLTQLLGTQTSFDGRAEAQQLLVELGAR